LRALFSNVSCFGTEEADEVELPDTDVSVLRFFRGLSGASSSVGGFVLKLDLLCGCGGGPRGASSRELSDDERCFLFFLEGTPVRYSSSAGYRRPICTCVLGST
jgi:hypothetical protein